MITVRQTEVINAFQLSLKSVTKKEFFEKNIGVHKEKIGVARAAAVCNNFTPCLPLNCS